MAIYLKPSQLPLATLAKTTRPESLLKAVAERVDIIEDSAERSNVAACVQLLAVISFSKALINMYLMYLWEELMRESVVYQSIVAESTQKVIQQGLDQGRQQGLQQGESTVILRILKKRFGSLPERVRAEVSVLATECLKELGEALLDFTQLSGVEDWLGEIDHG